MTQSPTTTRSSRGVVVLGSTGSIGVSCLDVLSQLGDRFHVVGLSANTQWDVVQAQALRCMPRWVTLTGSRVADRPVLHDSIPGCRVMFGEEGIARMVSDPDVDIVVNAIVGAAGLVGTWEALAAGKTVALANKETLVMAGSLVMDRAARCGARLVPVDSEHSAIFQALQAGNVNELERIVLTASGGPFRGRTRGELQGVTAAEALRHPTWQMGPKITVDSATLMNKALEIIEAHWLFRLRSDQIEVLIHPESVVHSFVEFRDASILAQLSPPDMRLPIQYALTFPERLAGPAKRLCWKELRALHFEPPDLDTFPALQLGYEVARSGGTAGACLNAANEAAVARFLSGNLPFLDIPRVCREVLENHHYSQQPTLSELYTVDRWARQEVARWNTATGPVMAGK